MSQSYVGINPATGQVNNEYPHTTDAEISEALDKAVKGYKEWRAKSVKERGEILAKVADLFVERRRELGEIATKEMGKPFGEARGEAAFSGEIIRYYAENAEEFLADEVIKDDEDGKAVIQKRPLGPLVGVMPWNYPYYQVARFAGPNLMLGNVVLLKHAESTPDSALAIQKIMDDAGVPEGVYQNIFASHEQIASLIENPEIAGVSLTGSERAGREVGATAGKALKKSVLELGGNDPYVILSSEDPRQAARDAIAIRFENTGQACNSNKRLIVMEDIYDEFLDELIKETEKLQAHDPMEKGENVFGPLSSEKAAERLVDQLERAVSEGANLRVGGTRLDRPGFYVQPAVLTDIPKGTTGYSEELFGPVLSVYKVTSDEEALELANDTAYGLGSAVFAVEEGRAERFAEGIDAGMVGVNGTTFEDVDMPFGGVKGSGFGRELGALGIDEFVNKRLVCFNN